jgi:protein-disulfide isomerase
MVRAGYCFSRKDRFWEWNDAVLASPKPTYGPKRRTYEGNTAAELGFDRSDFDTCMGSEDSFEYAERIYQETVGNKIKATPAYLVDGKRVTLKELADMIDKRLE